MESMPLMTRLELAQQAIAYVKSVIKWPATNRPEDVAHRQAHNMPIVGPAAMRRRLRNYVETHGLWHGSDAIEDNIDAIRARAEFAIAEGVGWCDELAAIAFAWLIDVRDAPCHVGYYQLYDGKAPFHSFVMIGETSRPQFLYFVGEGIAPQAWPMDAVWCDPWRGDCFEIKDDWDQRMRKVVEDCGKTPGIYTARCKAFRAAGRAAGSGAQVTSSGSRSDLCCRIL